MAEINSTTGHEDEVIDVQGLKASLQKLKTNHIDKKADTNSLGTAAAKNVPASGNAGDTEVVMGNDTRLFDSRKASDVFAWAKSESKPTYTASEVGAIPTNEKGVANGVASLDSAGKVPSSQLPSYVHDVVELLAISATAPEHCAKGDLYFNTTTSKVVEATGTDTWGTNTDPEKGKIYVNVSNNKSYRWGGSVMVEISSSVDMTDVAFLDSADGTAYSASFDPQDDTVWNKAQVLTAAQKAQVKTNLDIQDIVFNTAYNASTNKAATMADIPSSLPAKGGNSATVNNHTVAADVPSNSVFTDTTYVFNTAYDATTNKAATMADIPSVTGKEDKITIQSASGATLTAVVGKYYTMSNVGTLAITLPTIAAGTTTLQAVAFYISAGSSPAVTFSSTHSIYYSEGFEIAANTTYEVNAVYNGIAWVVTSVKIITSA